MNRYDFNGCGVLEAINLINKADSQAEYIAASWAAKEAGHSGVVRRLEGRIVLEWLAENGAFFDAILAEQWLEDLIGAKDCGCK